MLLSARNTKQRPNTIPETTAIIAKYGLIEFISVECHIRDQRTYLFPIKKARRVLISLSEDQYSHVPAASASSAENSRTEATTPIFRLSQNRELVYHALSHRKPHVPQIPLHHATQVIPLLYITYAALFLLKDDSVRRAESANDTGTKEHLDKKDSIGNGPSDSTRSPTSFFKPIFTLILDLPSSSVKLRKLSFLINSILLLSAADFVTHPIRHPAHDVTFVRVGAVDHRSAKISLRYPGSNSTDRHAVKVLFRPFSGDSTEQARWIEGPVVELLEQEDWANVTRIPNLWPSTTYEYKLAVPDSNHDLPYPASPLRFETFPDPRLTAGSHFRFIATSCILPNFPYVPGKGNRIKGFDLMAEALRQEQSSSDASPSAPSTSSQSTSPDDESVPSPHNLEQPKDSPLPGETPLTKFLLLLGDFIYADVPYYYGNSLEAYRRLYRRVYASPSFRKVYERLPTLNIYDDHEILNNFSGLENDTSIVFPNASNTFELYNARANYDPKDKDKYYYDFRIYTSYGDVAFFVLDARRHRSSSPETHPTMLGDQQAQALLNWLAEANQTSTFKFIVSSVPFTTLWQHDAQVDTWAGFRHERSSLLETLHTVPNLFILSGDRHEFAAIEFNGPFDWVHPIYEFSTSPLNMFYMPIIRTLDMQSSAHVERTRKLTQVSEEDGTPMIIEEKYQIPEERVIQYLPLGNHKWTSFEIDTRDPSKPSITAEVIIDGRLAYRYGNEILAQAILVTYLL
uniref:Phosphodie terase n=1 Tax=Inonotus obliquus TaxID=167356 RepID=A0A345BJX3_9AGAM|nr:phosphodie terase [Inonotus obliquus]